MSALCYVWYLRVFSGNVGLAGSLLTVSCFIHCLVSGLFVFFSWGSDTRGLESHKSHSTRGRGGEFEKVNAKQMHLHKF